MPIFLLIFLLLFAFAHSDGEGSNMKDSDLELRIYDSYSYPVDPSHVVILADIEIAYSVADRLIDLSDAHQAVGGLAERWEVVSEKVVHFTLRENLKWSDGSLLSASDAVASLDRSKRIHGKNLGSFFDMVVSIRAENAQTLAIELNIPVISSDLLLKLTEPMYGIVSLDKTGAINYSRSSSAYILASQSSEELRLKINPFWRKYSPQMAKNLVIKQSTKTIDLKRVMLDSSWPNLVSVSSLMPESLRDEIKRDRSLSIWKRSLNRGFLVVPCPLTADEDSYSLIKILNANLNREKLLKDLTGYRLSNQLFPEGNPLHDSQFNKTDEVPALPKKFLAKPLRILATRERVPESLLTAFAQEVQKLTGLKPIVKIIDLADFYPEFTKDGYDLSLGSVGVNDPNPAGAMAWLFEMDVPYITSGQQNYPKKLKEIRERKKSEDRVSGMRDILSDASRRGHVLPLFHYSKIVLTRGNINISAIPVSDEALTFSKITVGKNGRT